MLFVVVETVHIMGGARAMPSPARVILAQGPSDCPQLCNRIFDTCHCIGLMLLRPSSFHTGGGVGPTGGVGRGCSACANQNLQRGSPPFERILASLSPTPQELLLQRRHHACNNSLLPRPATQTHTHTHRDAHTHIEMQC